MIYNYCGVVFYTNIIFPFFCEDKVNSPNFEVLFCEEKNSLEYETLFFKKGNMLILNFGERGHYEISEERMICHFFDKDYMYATICNIPFAIVCILRGMLPLHSSSLINVQNEAYLLLGEKGTGKTTTACLLNANNFGYIFGDDMVSLYKQNDNIHVYQGSKLMKVSSKTATFLDAARIGEEVYSGVDKKYYTPKERLDTYGDILLGKIFLLERGKEINCKKAPEFLCKSIISRHIVGILVIEQFFSKEINNILNALNLCEVYNLIVPDTINDLNTKIDDLFSVMSQENEYDKKN